MFKYKILFINILLYITFIFSNENPIFFTSIPKCGTHLLAECLFLLTGKEQLNLDGDKNKNFDDHQDFNKFKNEFFFHKHLTYSTETIEFIKKNNLISFFIIRDPRDQVVSFSYWIYKHPHIYGDLCKLKLNDLISEVIKNTNSKVQKPLTDYINWINEPNICTVKFEDLIGQKGGGSEEKQIKEIKKIAKHLNFKLHPDHVRHIINNLWGTSNTFRNGKIGEWKKYFTQEQKDAFKKLYGQLLIDLGYEEDLNW